MSAATMPRNGSDDQENQELELTLGNKAMLTVFFVVVFLLGVFFAMGYVVGRNSMPVDAASNRDEPYVRRDAPSAMAPAAERLPESLPAVPQNSIATESPAPAAAAAEPAMAPVTVTEPQVGQMFLQVLAVAKPEAEVLAEVLAKKGFRAIVAPGPNDKIFRVLVGPARDTAEASKLRTDLEAAGFKPFIKRY